MKEQKLQTNKTENENQMYAILQIKQCYFLAVVAIVIVDTAL